MTNNAPNPIPNPDLDKNKDSEDKTKFLLAEYSYLNDFRSKYITLIETRLTGYIALVSGAFFGSTFIVNNKNEWGNFIYYPVGFIFFVLFLMGINIFFMMVERYISIVQAARGLNKIRHYFNEQFSLEDYLVYPIYDVPKFGALGPLDKGGIWLGVHSLVAIINSAIVGIILSMISKYMLHIDDFYSSILGIMLFIIVLSIEYWYVSYRLKKENQYWERNNKIKFRTPPKVDSELSKNNVPASNPTSLQP